MKHTTTADNPFISRILEWLNTKSKVLLQLLIQTLLDMAGSTELTLLTEEWRIVDGEEHTHGWLINSDWRKWLWILIITDGITNLKLLQTNNCTDITRIYMISLLVTHTLECMKFLNLGLLLCTITMADCYIHGILQSTTMNTTYGDTTCIRAVVERSNKELRSTLQLLRSRDNLYNLVEQIVDVVCRIVVILSHPTILGRTIYYREIKLILSSIKVAHEIEYHLINFLWTAVRLIHLINNNDRLQTELQSFLQHETGLRHRTLESVNKQETTVCHIEHALHLTTEVGVSRSIEDIDFNTFPIDRYIL